METFIKLDGNTAPAMFHSEGSSLSRPSTVRLQKLQEVGEGREEKEEASET